MQVVSIDERHVGPALTKLLRDELRVARFSIVNLIPGDAQFALRDGSTQTTLERTSEKELDADGLKDLHDTGAWKRDLFRSEIRVKAIPGGAESVARRTSFEYLLDDLGVLSDGHVATALGPLLPGYTYGHVQPDSPSADIGVAETADLWSYLLVDACLHSPRRTATKVLRWASGAHLAFETRVLLGRLHAADPFVLANGLTVAPVSRRSKDVDDWLPTAGGISPSDFLGRTILRIPCMIAPALSKPSRVAGQRDGVPAVSWNIPANIKSTWQLPLGGIHELTRALSLVCDVAVETPMIWTHYGDHAHFGERCSSSYLGTGVMTPRNAKETPLTAHNFKEALRVQSEFRKSPRKLQTAVRYWLKSKARGTDVRDGLVFIRTALEALFLDDGNHGEQTFRLAIHGAWYTGRERVDRRDRYKVLRDVYGAASGAVHGGRVKGNSVFLLEDGQEICRQAIIKRLRSKKEPVWRNIIFGR